MSVSVKRAGFSPPVRASRGQYADRARPVSGLTSLRIAPIAAPSAARSSASRAPVGFAVQEAGAPHAALISRAYGASEELDLMPGIGRWLDRRI